MSVYADEDWDDDWELPRCPRCGSIWCEDYECDDWWGWGIALMEQSRPAPSSESPVSDSLAPLEERE